MKKSGNDKRGTKSGGRKTSRETGKRSGAAGRIKSGKAGEKRTGRSGDEGSDDRRSYRRNSEEGNNDRRTGRTSEDTGERRNYSSRDKDEKRNFGRRNEEGTDERRTHRRNEETGERRNYGSRDIGSGEKRTYSGSYNDARHKGDYSRRGEGTDERRNSVRNFDTAQKENAGRKKGDEDRTERKSLKKEDRPVKAGTRPAGRRAREEGERRPRTATESQRDEIRKDRSFDRQDGPYKAGTRPAGKGYRSEEGKGEEKNYERRDTGERSYSRGEDDRYKESKFRGTDRDKGSRYGDKRNFRDKEKKSFDRPSKDGKTRLNKYIANSGICSRREADDLISAGVISVNGETITELGYKISTGDVVKYNDRAIRSEKLVYVLLNKPKDFITTTDDPQNRRTVMNLIQGAGKERIYPVGRLDRATTGVLLFTNDGELTKKLTHPSHEIKKIYQVELDQTLKSSDMDKIKDGVELEDGVTQVDEIFYSGDSKKTVGVELHSGKNRIVRRLFEALDYKVVKLDRVYFAGLTKKDLTRGRWRFLTEVEIANLKMLTAKKHKKSVDQ